MTLFVLLEIDSKEPIIEANDIGSKNFPFC